MRRMVDYAKFKLAPPADVTALPPRDLSAHLKSATLSEFDSKSLLRDAGIALPDEVLVTEQERAGRRDRARRLSAGDENPVAATSRTRAKSAASASTSPPRARRSRPIDALLDSARQASAGRRDPGRAGRPDGEEGRRDHRRHACTDATFGPMIMVGLGGITTELFRDVIYRPAPVSAAEASAMLANSKAAPLLNGFRGAAKADVAGAVAIDLADLACLPRAAASEISEIELNPVLVHPEGQGVTIVDALVVPKAVSRRPGERCSHPRAGVAARSESREDLPRRRPLHPATAAYGSPPARGG